MSKNENIETPEVIDEVDVIELEPECENESEGIGFGKIALASLLVVGGVAALGYKFRNKIEEHQIQKLENKGYHIQRPSDEIEADDDLKVVEVVDQKESKK